jgi:hypothetical protein
MWIDIFPVNVHPTAMEKPKKEGALYVHQKKSKKKPTSARIVVWDLVSCVVSCVAPCF